MENSEEDLLNAIKLYESQLQKVNSALEASSSDSEKNELTSLKANITELLELTYENLETVRNNCKGNNSKVKSDNDPFADEYALFKAELADLNEEEEKKEENDEESSNNLENDCIDIQEELDELVGSKCQAPFKNKLNITNYYNALVSSVHVPEGATDTDDIQVCVMFTNPVEKGMVPCPFYLDGKCKFSDSNCNYSHGYIVPFTDLREYKEPEFSLIRNGCRVLAKPTGSQLWVATKIEQVLTDDVCSIKHHGVSVQVPIHDIFPLSSSQGEEISDEDEDDDDKICEFGVQIDDEIIEKSLTDNPLSYRLGAWEQHTKGIGSKLMAKMGYVVGTGLGKQAEGRLEPVQALILPPGKSLDHCMQLREAAGGSKDLFSVERLQKKLALQAQKRSMRMYKKQKHEEQHNVFNIINNTLAAKKESTDENSMHVSLKKQLESSSSRALNVEKLKTEEDIISMQRDIYILNDKLSLKKEGSVEYKNISAKLNSAREKLEALQKRDGKIAWEINVRETKKKMVF